MTGQKEDDLNLDQSLLFAARHDTWLVGSLVIQGFEFTGFLSQIAVTKKLESNHHKNKQKFNDTSSVNQMVIR